MRTIRFQAAGLSSLCLLLSACGGGGDGSPTVTELPPSIAISSATKIEADTAAEFSSDAGSATRGLKFRWDFGDGGSSTDTKPTHQFGAAGAYTVTLTVTNEAGASRSTSFNVTVGHYGMVKDAVCSMGPGTGWCWQRPRPTGNATSDIFFIDAGNGWAVGDAGQILKTSDGGATWTAQTSNVTTPLTQVKFADAQAGWALGADGTVVKTVDGGATWTPLALNPSYYGYSPSYTLTLLDASRVMLSTPYGSGQYTLNGGNTWTSTSFTPTQITSDGTLWHLDTFSLSKAALGSLGVTVPFQSGSYSVYLQQFSMGDAQHGMVTGYDWNTSTALYWRTADAGATWQPLTPNGLPAAYNGPSYLKLFGADIGWAMTGGTLYRSTDGGANWSPVAFPSNLYYYYPTPVAVDGQTLWFTAGAGVYITRDGGGSWTPLSVATEAGPPSRLQIVGSTYLLQYVDRLYRSTDNGSSWKQVLGAAPGESTGNLGAVWFFDGKNGLATSNGGWLLSTQDGGLTWTNKALTGQSSFVRTHLQFTSNSTGWLSGSSGVSKTTDGGQTWWLPLTSPDFTNVLDFHFVDANHGWAIGGMNAMYKTADGGSSWTKASDLPGTGLGLRFIDSSTGVVAGSNGSIYRTTDGGASWSLRPTGVSSDLRRVVFVDANIGWAVGANGTVVKTTNAGLTWARVPVPSSIGLLDVVFTDANHGWIVGEGGTVLMTTDGGRSWGAQASGTARGLYGAFFLDAHTGWVVGEGSTVLATATGGN